jgi:hypothetical protein
MTTYRGSSKVNPGYYLSTTSFGVEVIGEDGGTLPGLPSARFLKVPFPLLFLVVPIIGLAFLVALPALGFGLLAYAIVRRVTGHVADRATDLAAAVAPDAATGAAYLAGQAHQAQEEPATAQPIELEMLEKEIDEKRS